MFRTGCPGLCVLRFKYSAAPTRRTTETTVGTGLPNHCLHQPYWFYFLNSFISSLLCWVIVHICVWRLWLKTFSISSVQFLQSVCLHPVSSVYAFCTLCLSSFHHDDYACILLCLLLSTYSAASSSSLRNFLTCKFLSEEFIKIAYSPPSSRYNALSIVIRARYSLVLCDFGLTAWSFSYVDRRYDQGLCWVSYLRWDGLPLLEE